MNTLVRIVPVLIAVVGFTLLIGGASSYLVKSGSTVVCEACGMEVQKDDVSTMRIVSLAGETHWACCPVCSMVVALYYENATLHADCFNCAQDITIAFAKQNITSVSPLGGTYNVTMLFGMSCIKNKLACSNGCANNVKTQYDWAASLPSKTMNQTLSIAWSKYSQFTIGYKPIKVPEITYGLIYAGIAVLIAAPLEWILIEKKKTAEAEKNVQK